MSDTPGAAHEADVEFVCAACGAACVSTRADWDAATADLDADAEMVCEACHREIDEDSPELDRLIRWYGSHRSIGPAGRREAIDGALTALQHETWPEGTTVLLGLLWELLPVADDDLDDDGQPG